MSTAALSHYTEADMVKALTATGTKPAASLPLPAALVNLYPETIGLDPDAMGWLGDFERCLAWAWVERVWSVS